MSLIAFHLADGRVITNRLEKGVVTFPVPAVNAGVTRVEIDHPQLRLTLIAPNYFVINEVVQGFRVGKSTYVVVGVYRDGVAKAYKITRRHCKPIDVDPGRYDAKTWNLILKPAA